MLLELGQRLCTAGAIQQAQDIFWLERNEIEGCIASLDKRKVPDSLEAVVEQRKVFHNTVKRITPPPMIPLKKKFWGINTDVFVAASESEHTKDTLKGVAASPGVVTAPACVLRGSEDFDKMKPGCILIAGTTTPAWTPLFAMAVGVVTDIGGPLSHGSIVAREYGIPAVMGTSVATRRIKDGQIITVDGSTGMVTLA